MVAIQVAPVFCSSACARVHDLLVAGLAADRIGAADEIPGADDIIEKHRDDEDDAGDDRGFGPGDRRPDHPGRTSLARQHRDVDGGGGKSNRPDEHRPGVADPQASAISRRNRRNGTITAVDSRIATGSPRRYPRHAVRLTPDSTTGSRMNPTSPNCRPMNSPTVRSDNSWVAVARTSWKRNDAQSCPAFQIRTGRNTTTAISAAAHG